MGDQVIRTEIGRVAPLLSRRLRKEGLDERELRDPPDRMSALVYERFISDEACRSWFQTSTMKLETHGEDGVDDASILKSLIRMKIA